MNATSIAQVRNGLASCVSAAVQKGMHVSFTAHVDDSTASSVAKWRNRLLLDPFQPFGGECVDGWVGLAHGAAAAVTPGCRVPAPGGTVTHMRPCTWLPLLLVCSSAQSALSMYCDVKVLVLPCADLAATCTLPDTLLQGCSMPTPGGKEHSNSLPAPLPGWLSCRLQLL